MPKETITRQKIINAADRLGFKEPLSINALCAVQKDFDKKKIYTTYGELSATYAGHSYIRKGIKNVKRN